MCTLTMNDTQSICRTSGLHQVHCLVEDIKCVYDTVLLCNSNETLNPPGPRAPLDHCADLVFTSDNVQIL